MTWCTWYLNYRSQMPQHKNKWQFHLANQSNIVEKHFRGHFWQSIRKYSFIYFNFRFLNLNNLCNLCNLWRELMQVKLKILTNLVIVPLHERVKIDKPQCFLRCQTNSTGEEEVNSRKHSAYFLIVS